MTQWGNICCTQLSLCHIGKSDIYGYSWIWGGPSIGCHGHACIAIYYPMYYIYMDGGTPLGVVPPEGPMCKNDIIQGYSRISGGKSMTYMSFWSF
jgi:hypothetical protein